MKILVILLLFITNFCYSQSFYFDCYEHSSRMTYGEYPKQMIREDGKIWIDSSKQIIYIKSGDTKNKFKITKWDKEDKFIESENIFFWFDENQIIVRKWINGLGFIQLHFYSKQYKL